MDVEHDAYRALFDANPRPMIVADRATRAILAVNAAACAYYDRSRDELLAMTLRDLRPSEDPAMEITDVVFAGRPASLAVITDVTGIAQAERRFRLLVEHSADGIAITNAVHVVEYVSPGGQRILGARGADSAGIAAAARTHPDDIAAWHPPAPGETTSYLARTLHRDGTWRWIESSTTNLTHEPAVQGYVSNFRDITERKLAEQALVESQQRLEFLLSATSAITYSAHVPGPQVTFISANVATVLGYPRAAFVDDPGFWRARVHAEDLARYDGKLAALATRETVTLEYRFRHADGRERWMRDVARLVRDANGRGVELVGSWIDVTDQVHTHASLQRSEANFRALIERAPTATFVHRHGRYLYVNPAAVAMLGYASAAEIVGKQVLDFIVPDDREMVRGRMEHTERTGGTPTGTGRMIRADGSVFVIECEGIRLDFDGEPTNVVMGHDVTARNEVFARMAVADRMLSVGTLAAGVAHEINNPLAYVSANVDVLAAELPTLLAHGRSRLGDVELRGLVADVRDGVARVGAIVRDLRDLSSPSEADARGPVDLVAVIGSAIRMAHNEIRHHAEVEQHYADALPPVDGDPIKLGQVFLNLLLNAAHAIAERRAEPSARDASMHHTIRIRATATPDRARVRVDVEDTGVGIPAAIVRRIFDPFFTTKRSGAGTGLGLAISHRIVYSMNGEITVASTPGRGSTFTVTLPASTAVPAGRLAPEPPATAVQARVLLIDDEPALGRSMRLLLAPENDVVVMTGAKDALACLATGERFDAIVCDLMMPDVSGIEFYEQLTRVAPRYTDRLVFMTGGAFTPQARAFLASLPRPPLQKPFTVDQLRRAIETVVR